MRYSFKLLSLPTILLWNQKRWLNHLANLNNPVLCFSIKDLLRKKERKKERKKLLTYINTKSPDSHPGSSVLSSVSLRLWLYLLIFRSHRQRYWPGQHYSVKIPLRKTLGRKWWYATGLHNQTFRSAAPQPWRVKAEVPLSEMFGYVTQLRTITSGRASSSMEFSHYNAAPANIAADVIEKSKGTVKAWVIQKIIQKSLDESPGFLC